MNTTHLIIVVPCYNEESVLPETIRQLSGVLNRMLENGKISIGKILFVDDGSKDKTWEIITEAGKTNGLVGGLKLAHNSGHQYADKRNLRRNIFRFRRTGNGQLFNLWKNNHQLL